MTRDLEAIFDDYCSPERFLIYNRVDKEQLLSDMIKTLSPQEDGQYLPRMKQLVDQREGMSSVVFSDHIAVPHPISPLGHYHRMAIAIVKQGLVWETNYPSIKLVFLPSFSVYDNEGLSSLTDVLVKLTDLPEVQEKLLACHSFEDFRTLFLGIAER